MTFFNFLKRYIKFLFNRKIVGENPPIFARVKHFVQVVRDFTFFQLDQQIYPSQKKALSFLVGPQKTQYWVFITKPLTFFSIVVLCIKIDKWFFHLFPAIVLNLILFIFLSIFILFFLFFILWFFGMIFEQKELDMQKVENFKHWIRENKLLSLEEKELFFEYSVSLAMLPPLSMLQNATRYCGRCLSIVGGLSAGGLAFDYSFAKFSGTGREPLGDYIKTTRIPIWVNGVLGPNPYREAVDQVAALSEENSSLAKENMELRRKYDKVLDELKKKKS